MSASSTALYPPVSLPNEGPPEPAAGPPDPIAVAAPPPRRFTPFRLALLGGGVLLAAGGAFVLPQLAAGNRIDLSSIRLPAAVRPSQFGPAPTTAPAPAPAADAPASPAAGKGAPSSFMDDIAGLDAVGPVAAPSAMSAAPAAPSPVHPDPAPTPAPAAAPVPAAPATGAQADPAETVLKLVPAPTSSAEEVSLLGLVTAIAAELRTSREDNAALRDQVKALSSSFDGRLEDLERRTRFREAQEAVAGMRAPLPFADPGPSPAVPHAVLTVTAQADAWRVQGGSPRMAVLAPTGSGPIKIVRVGDAIDERLGKVERIYQDGRLWVVKAEHGSVRGGE